MQDIDGRIRSAYTLKLSQSLYSSAEDNEIVQLCIGWTIIQAPQKIPIRMVSAEHN